MRSSKVLTNASLLYLAPMSIAQSTYSPISRITWTADPKSCIRGGGVTSYSDCPALFSAINYCDQPSIATGLQALACYCNQGFLNLLFGCHDEERLCLGDTNLDGSFESQLDTWNSACNNRTTAAITTPQVSPIIVSNNIDYCTTIFSACNSASTSENDCDNSYSGKSFSSCFCQPRLLSLVYTCEFLGNVSCLHYPAALTNMLLYGFCANFVSVLGGLANETAPASAPATITSKANPSQAPSNTVTLTTPLAPGSSKQSTGPTTTKSSIGVSLHTMSLRRELLAIFLVVPLLLVS